MPDTVPHWQTTTREVRVAGLADISKLLEKSRISGAALELEEIRDILLLADRAQQWRETGLHPPVSMTEVWPAIEELSRGIIDTPAAAR